MKLRSTYGTRVNVGSLASPWAAQIREGGRVRYLGCLKTRRSAHLAAIRAVKSKIENRDSKIP